MAGTTYSRTSGQVILESTKKAAAALFPGQSIDWSAKIEQEAYLGTGADPESRQYFSEALKKSHGEPPAFLKFAVAKSVSVGVLPPSATPAGQAQLNDARMSEAKIQEAAQALGIDIEGLKRELKNFSGEVVLFPIKAGTVLYRTVGLIAPEKSGGYCTNALDGAYWENRCPNSYSSVDEWRAATAVLPEWNGDMGHVKFTFTKDVYALYGDVKAQRLTIGDSKDLSEDMFLPGGGKQYYIPNLSQQDPGARSLIESKLSDVIHETIFGSEPR